MSTLELKQILDKEIEFSRNSPLGKSLNPDFVDGFIKGLEQAKYLIGASNFLDTLDTCLRSDRTRGLFITGKRGSGKTTKLIEAVRHISANYGFKGVVVVPTSTCIKRVTEEMCKPGDFTFNASRNLLVNMIHHYAIDIYSGDDPTRFRGLQYGVAFIDDIENINTDTLDILNFGLRLNPAKLVVAGTELPTNPNLGILTGYHL